MLRVMAIRTVGASVLVLVCAPAAYADPIAPLGDLPDGDLRVDLQCADYWATPSAGLRVTVDGAPADATGTNGRTVTGVGKHGAYTAWVPTDVGFLAAARRASRRASTRRAAPPTSATSRSIRGGRST